MRRKSIDSQDFNDGTDSITDIPVEGDVQRAGMVEAGIEQPNTKGFDAYAAELAFMEEPVKILLHESTDENAEPIVDLYCNGTPQRLIRGMEQVVKRKYVQILCNARQTSIKTQTGVQGDNVVSRVNKHTAVRYPFSVIEDRNPKGAPWLRAQLQAS